MNYYYHVSLISLIISHFIEFENYMNVTFLKVSFGGLIKKVLIKHQTHWLTCEWSQQLLAFIVITISTFPNISTNLSLTTYISLLSISVCTFSYIRFLEWKVVGDLMLGTWLILLDAYQTVSWWDVWSRIAVVSSVRSGRGREKSLHAYLSCLASTEGAESRHLIMCPAKTVVLIWGQFCP